jgi:hypothetical protein
MKQSQRKYPFRYIVSSLFMIAALLWLTVSTPFVYDAQQSLKKEAQKQSEQTQDDNSNPFSNTTEEKNESGVNTLSEYLHEPPSIEKNFITLIRLYKSYPSNIYFEYHPELVSPPPEA